MIRIYPDEDSLARGAAELFVSLADKAVRTRGRFLVALAGGTTPRHMYELLARPEFIGRMSWADTHIFWGDERCVPPSSPMSNERMAREALLDHVPVPASQIHPLRCGMSCAEAALLYDSLLRQSLAGLSGTFDLVLLGLGENGHTVSLFPHNEVLKENTRWVREVFLPPPNINRITLTPPVINDAAAVVFLAAGAAKALTIKAIIEKTGDPCDLPALLIQPRRGGQLYWLLDKDAAALLQDTAFTD